MSASGPLSSEFISTDSADGSAAPSTVRLGLACTELEVDNSVCESADWPFREAEIELADAAVASANMKW